MTRIPHDKPLIRETSVEVYVAGKLRPLLIEVHPGFIVYRPKGTRIRYMVDHKTGYERGAKIKAGV
jgi:hypothetical protein